MPQVGTEQGATDFEGPQRPEDKTPMWTPMH